MCERKKEREKMGWEMIWQHRFVSAVHSNILSGSFKQKKMKNYLLWQRFICFFSFQHFFPFETTTIMKTLKVVIVILLKFFGAKVLSDRVDVTPSSDASDVSTYDDLSTSMTDDDSSNVVLSDTSYLRIDAGIYSKLTVAVSSDVSQPKNCQTFLDNLEVSFWL